MSMGLGGLGRIGRLGRPAPSKGGGVPALARAFWASLLLGTSDLTLLVAGDSTGNGFDEWVHRLLVDMEDSQSSHYIDYYLYDDATKAYILTALLGRTSTYGVMTDTFDRADGALGTTSSGGQTWAANSWTIASNRAVPNATSSNLTVSSSLASTSFKFEGVLADPTTGDYRVYFCNGSGRYVAVFVNASGSVSIFHHDGTTGSTIKSMSSLGTSNGVDFTLRVVKDGLDIYVEYNGREMVGTLTQPQEDALTGRQCYITSVTSVTGHSWASYSVGNLVKPSRRLKVRNGSVSGAGFTYHTTNIATLIPERPDFAFVSLGHNESSSPATFTAAYATYVAAARSQAGGAEVPIASVIQNPQIAPRTAQNIADHAGRMLALKAVCPAQQWDRVDVYDAFNNDPGGLALLIDGADGIHPITAGNVLWEATTAARMGIA